MLQPISLKQRVQKSNKVVEGEVLSSQSFWNSTRTNIYTKYKIKPYKVFKGNVNSEFYVVVQGGTVGTRTHDVSNEAQLKIGDYGVFTMINTFPNMPTNGNTFALYAAVQGFIKIDVREQFANDPFNVYKDLETELYQPIERYSNSKARVINTYNFNALNQNRSFLATPVISSFSPTTSTAGTFETIVISGSGFGNTQGTVEFKNSNNGGLTNVATLQNDIISWSDTSIETTIPMLGGTGVVKVVLPGGAGSDESTSSLNIEYSQINAASSTTSYRQYRIDDNGTGGFDFVYESAFNNNSIAVTRFEEAYNYWKCSSATNFSFVGTTTVSDAADDNVNVVMMSNSTYPLPAGVAGQVVTRIISAPCGNNNVPVDEIDVIWSSDINFNYSTNDPISDSYSDFKTVALHELGHALGLAHVIDENKVMHYNSPPGTSSYILSQSDINGANYLMAFNTSSPTCALAGSTEQVVEITSQPQSATLCTAGTHDFSITATNVEAYKWQLYNTATSTWSDLSNSGIWSGTSTSTLNVDYVIGNEYEVRCKLTDDCGAITYSNEVTLDVIVPTQNLTLDVIVNPCSEGQGSFSIETTADAGLASYQLSIDNGSTFPYTIDPDEPFFYITGLSNGSYQFITRESSSDTCTQSKGTFTISDTLESGPIATIQSTTAGSDCDTPDGEITLTITDAAYRDQMFISFDGGTTYSAYADNSSPLTINGFEPDNYNVFVAFDEDGLCATSVGTATVGGCDTEDPVAVCQNITVYLDETGDVTVLGEDVDNGSTDNVGIDSFMLSKSEFTCNDIGNNDITLTVEDVAGNSDSCLAVITVVDNIAPEVIASLETSIYVDTSGDATLDPDVLLANFEDACGTITLTADTTAFNCSNIGDNTIQITATDNYGNAATYDAIVTVVDQVFACVNDADTFKTTWQTTTSDESITIPTTGTGYDYVVDWGDGSTSVHSDADATTDASHIYATAGTYTVRIIGDFPRIYMHNSADISKIKAVNQWGTIVWSSMQDAFRGCTNLNISASDAPDLSQVTNLSYMFREVNGFTVSLSNWDVSTVTNMEGMFYFTTFNRDISSWNVANVTTFKMMFIYNQVFNQNIGSWNTGSVTDMESMFLGANQFNQDISGWNVSNVTNTKSMFYAARNFNQDISNWNVSSVTDAFQMFRQANKFNQDISSWDVSNITDMSRMFYQATSFEQNLGAWDISSVTDMDDMFLLVTLNTDNYDATLTGWATLDAGETAIPSNIDFHGGTSKYCASNTDRQNLITSYGWSISDSGITYDCYDFDAGFITTWETTANNESITIPTTGTGYDYVVDWGDGTLSGHSDADASTNATHSYATAGTYTIKVAGDFHRIYFNSNGDHLKINTIEQWGNIQWSSMENAFSNCFNLIVKATDVPDLSNVTSLKEMFNLVDSFDDALGNWNWDVSNITDMSNMFGLSNFNGDISSWNVSNVEDFNLMFSNAYRFNQDIGNWNMQSATDLSLMFFEAIKFNQDIGNWNIQNVTNLNRMFYKASLFDQNLGNWDISNATNVKDMFFNSALTTSNYDAILIGWNTLDAANGETTIPTGLDLGDVPTSYCAGATARQELISTHNWTITDDGRDYFCYDFDAGFITTWETTTDAESITITTTGTGYDYVVDWGDGSFSGHSDADASTNATHSYATAGTYTVQIIGDFPRIYMRDSADKTKLQTVNQWGTIAWSSMRDAFRGCTNLTVSASDAPDLSQVTNMSYMFSQVAGSTASLNNWDVSTITNMAGMFTLSTFNGDISSWNVSNVTTFNVMFAYNQNFNQNIGAWNTSSVTNMEGMFLGANQFDQDISAWDISNVSTMVNMFLQTGLSTANYDATLIGWSTDSSITTGDGIDDIPSAITFDAGSSLYCASESARQELIDTYNWTINDAGLTYDCYSFENGFITTWQTTSDNEDITIPTEGAGYNYAVDWGDGSITFHTDADASTDATHTYATLGTHTVRISGDFPRIDFSNATNSSEFKINGVEQWGNISWVSMEEAFRGCDDLTINATDAPDLSNVTTLTRMFNGDIEFTSSLSNWDVSTIADMSNMFWSANFNGDISAWNVSNVTNFRRMFRENANFNQDISSWNVSNAQSLRFMFSRATSFNQNISSWDVGNVTDLSGVFFEATAFNQDISSWDTSAATTMLSMFRGATAFNQDISGWDVSNVISFNSMFTDATAFNQNIGTWDLSSITDSNSMAVMLNNSGLSTENYDATLIGWHTLDTAAGETAIPTNLLVGASGLTYCDSELQRQDLIDNFGWIIDDAGESPLCFEDDEWFVTTWQTTSDNEDITIPTEGTGYDYTVDWGDGSFTLHTDADASTDATHTYATAGTYTVRIVGDFPRIYFFSSSSRLKIFTVEQWGTTKWSSMFLAFYECDNLTINATDAPDLSLATDLSLMFFGDIAFTSSLSNWDVSTITTMSAMFSGTNFNGNISSWNVSNVTNFSGMFNNNETFNQDISGWNTANATNLGSMFDGATSFNQNISGWNVGNVTNFSSLFAGATSFNQDISGWNTANATNFGNMFDGASIFNQDISGWDVSNAFNFISMFENATAFNQNLGAWDISSVSSNTNSMSLMLNNSGLSTENYDATLIGWHTLDTAAGETAIPTNLLVGASGLTYCDSELQRQDLIDTYGWTIDDAGQNELCFDFDEGFITTWETTTDNESITIPTTGTGYNYTVDWGDGTETIHLDSDATTDATHTYATAGVHTVRIIGEFPRIYFNNSGDFIKILSVEQWGRIQWTNFKESFYSCSNLTIPATDAPNLSNVTDMTSAFRSCEALTNEDFSNWDVSNVTSLSKMFTNAFNFNGDVTTWNVGNVSNFNFMFASTKFNKDVSNWNVGEFVTGDINMAFMFNLARKFNQDISSWDVSRTNNMKRMFFTTDDFDQDLSAWDISNVTDMSQMFEGAGLSVTNYDNTLIGWATLDTASGETQIPTNIAFHGGNSMYCLSEIERQNLITTYGWTITDSGTDCTGLEFISIWETTTANESITIPTFGTGYNYGVDWGDGSFSTHSDADVTTDATHTYTNAGTYTVKITRNFPQIYFNNSGDRLKIQEVTQWGAIAWSSFKNAFYGSYNLTISATDAPDLSGVTDLSGAFRTCFAFTNEDFSNWDVSNITSLSRTFQNATDFNGDITTWDVGNVDNFTNLFSNVFINQDISNWNIGEYVTGTIDMAFMFYNASEFNQNISGWDVSKVSRMSSMFFSATDFDQDLGAWDISSVTDMDSMFRFTELSVTNYDNTLIGWATLDTTNGETVIPSNIIFDGGNSSYCDSEVERDGLINTNSWTITDNGKANVCNPNLTNAFITTWETTSANQTITIPTTGAGYDYIVDWGDGQYSGHSDSDASTDAQHTYNTAGVYIVKIVGDFPRIYFNDNLDADLIESVVQWGNIEWKNFNSAFKGCSNLVITATDAPNLTNVIDLSEAFKDAVALSDEDLSNWDVSDITNMTQIFYGCINFDGDVTSWDVGHTEDFSGMFAYSDFNQDISGWNIGAFVSGSISTENMFLDNATFNQDLSSWDMSNVTNTNQMFRDAIAFDQDLSNWDISNIVSMADMFLDAKISTSNYDNTLIGWLTLDAASGEVQIPSNVTFSGGNSNFCISELERQNLIDTYSWIITDGGKLCELSFEAPAVVTCLNSPVNFVNTSDTDGTYLWEITPTTFTFENGTDENSENPTVSFQEGATYTITLSAIDYPELTGVTQDIIVNEPLALNVTEDFESTIPPTSWTINNPDNDKSWEVFETIGIDGVTTNTIRMNNYNYDTSGEVDELILPPINISEADATFNFDLAYAYFSNIDFDRLMVEYSIDCGETFLPTTYDKEKDVLATAGEQVVNWQPSASADWRTETIDLAFLANQTVIFKIVSINGYGNNLYIDNIGIGAKGMNLSPKVYLQGAMLNSVDGLMRDDLRNAGYLPTTSPYGDNATCDATVFNLGGTLGTGVTSDDIVDWVWVELRDAAEPGIVVTGQSAFLQRDGDVVALDGTSILYFDEFRAAYYVVIKHRNHLGIMTANTMSLSMSTTIIDFTQENNQITNGTNAQSNFGMATGTIGLWAGNANGDNVVQYSGSSADAPNILSTVLNDPSNFLNFPTFTLSGYRNDDLNMDGNTQYSGSTPDTPYILQNVLSHPSNFLNFSTFAIQEQLPAEL